MGRLYNVHSTNTMASELLINPLKHNCTFDLRSVNYITSFYLLVRGCGDNAGMIWDEYMLRHWKSFETGWSWSRRIETHLRRYEACYDISFVIGMSFTGIWLDLRWFGMVCVALESSLTYLLWVWGKFLALSDDWWRVMALRLWIWWPRANLGRVTTNLKLKTAKRYI